MAESREKRIAELLQRGLDLYGEGRAEEAEACWGEVLFLDPDNVEARDYLDALRGEGEGFAVRDREAGAPARDAGPDPSRSPAPDRLGEAVGLMRRGRLEEALERFEAAARRDAGSTEVLGYLEMVRGKLLERYRERVGGPATVLQVRAAPADLKGMDLSASTGFLLSLVDGRTSVNELISISGFDAFDALRALHRLLEAGVVEDAR